MTDRLFKVLAEDGSAYHGGSGRWHLPVEDKPGKWMPAIRGKIVACERGYHLCRSQDLVYWLGPSIYEAEAYGDERTVVDGYDGKVVVKKARLIRRLDGWTERTARLFAIECAERVLPLYERRRSDPRPREALAVARRFADDAATREELDAARAAAWTAAWTAANAAAWADAEDAAWAAAEDAARAAAEDAAWAAAEDAAWAAAEDAAWAAARTAARATAWTAANAAAWTAARAAERQWQTSRLLEILGS